MNRCDTATFQGVIDKRFVSVRWTRRQRMWDVAFSIDAVECEPLRNVGETSPTWASTVRVIKRATPRFLVK